MNYLLRERRKKDQVKEKASYPTKTIDTEMMKELKPHPFFVQETFSHAGIV